MTQAAFQDTANRLMGICDSWSKYDIREHLEWLIDNPGEIAMGYDVSVFKKEYIEDIMKWVN